MKGETPMNSPNEEAKQTDNMERLKQQASDCAPGCACHSTGSSGRLRWVLGVIVLLVAATLVARAVVKSQGPSTEPASSAFAPLAPATPENQSPATPPATAEATEASTTRSIAALAELNTLAVASDAVFVYVPGKDGSPGDPPAAMKSAASRITSQGYKIALFTLQAGSRDHQQLAAQMSVPAVLAMVKGRGMSPVSGEVTETKLIQGFVAASNAGGCGPGGCGPAGCGPAGAK
jgi:hypothetical protein